MVTAAHGYLQPQRSHQCFACVLERSRIADEEEWADGALVNARPAAITSAGTRCSLPQVREEHESAPRSGQIRVIRVRGNVLFFF
ncbi:hypothetical protein EVAR_75195_1 [Eumeta japonica]|uniref:Uncharacterized protein n=1 Tax=Eumeta variegata TaxID=151549 RepID=A0A4C1U0P5_EUMVA|nr:hypothetical protein EVAR_75195_1 [Eumeta japonica]